MARQGPCTTFDLTTITGCALRWSQRRHTKRPPFESGGLSQPSNTLGQKMTDIKYATRNELLNALRHGRLVRTLGDHTSIYRYEGHDYYVSSAIVPELP